MKKRFIRLIALTLSLVMALSAAVMAVTASAADTKDEKYNFYVSDFLVEDSMNLTQTMIQGEFPTPYHHIYETLSKDVAWNLTMAAWSFLTFDFSDIVKITDKSIGFYEAILFDIFCDAQKSEESISDAELSSFSTALEVSKLIVEDYGDVLAIPLEDLKKDSEKYESIMSSIVDSELLAGALGEFKDILKYGSTLNEVITNCARLESLVCSYNNSIQILNDISAKTSDDNLKMACKRFAGYLNENIGSITYTVISAVEESAYALADFLIGKLWNIVCTELNGYGFVIEAGQKLGKLASNLLFSTEESKEHYYAICALHEFEKCLCLCVGDYQSNYIKSRTYENSALFNESFFLLGKTIVEGCEYAVKYYEITYEHGFANQAINAFIKGSEWLKHVFNDNYEIPKRDYEVYIEEVGVVKSRFISNMDFIENDCYECYLNSIEDIGNEIEVEHKPPVNTQEEIIQFNLEMQELCYKLSNVYIEKNKTLTEDMTIYGDLYMSANIDLNGHALNVIGNLYQTDGTMTINGGMLNVAGDYRIQEETINDDCEMEYSAVHSFLVMENDTDTVNVGGSFISRTNYESNSYMKLHTLTAGTLSVGGDFYDWTDGVKASGTHKTVLNGDEKQTVYFDSNSSYFNVIEAAEFDCSGYFNANSLNSNMTITSDGAEIVKIILNGKTVTINGSVKEMGPIDFDGGTLNINCDVKVNNSINLEGGTLTITGDVVMTKNTDLNGGTMTVNGTLRQTGGAMTINGGTLNVTGDYRIQEETINENGEVEYSAVSALLVMENDNDTVNVGGSFITRSCYSYYGTPKPHTMTAGTLTVGGVCDWDSDIQASGTHKTVIKGTDPEKNKVNIVSSTSCFNILEADNVDWSGYFNANSLNRNVNITSTNATIVGVNFNGYTLTITGDVEINAPIDLNGVTMTVNGTLRQTGGTMTINGGSLNITGDYRIQEETINDDGEVKYSAVYAILVMENDADTVNVGGSFITRSCYSYSSSPNPHTLTAGTLSVGGDVYDWDSDIKASGTHKTVLNGTEKQTVYFYSSSSYFNILEATDIECSGYFSAKSLDRNLTITSNGAKIWGIDLNGKTITIDGDVEMIGYICLRGVTMTVNGTLRQTGGEMNIKNGTLNITGDYLIQKETLNDNGEVEYSPSSGKLSMKNETDTVNVGGSFITRARDQHNFSIKHNMSAGTLTIGGDLYDWECNILLYESSTHKTVMNGAGEQTVYLHNPKSRFSIFKGNNIDCSGYFTAWSLGSDLNITSDGLTLWLQDLDGNALTINSDVVIDSDVDFNGGSLTINGDVEFYHTIDIDTGCMTVNGTLRQTGGNMNLYSGTLNVNGDYIIQNETLNDNGEVEYSSVDAFLSMNREGCELNINGDFITRSSYSISSGHHRLWYGTMTVGGDIYDWGADLQCDSDHKIILNGTGKQTVYFASSSSYLNILEITKPLADYNFIVGDRDIFWNKLILPDSNENESEVLKDLLLLDDGIGIKLNMAFKNYISNDKTAEIRYTVNGRTNSVSVWYTDEYWFDLPVAPADMDEQIVVQIYVNGQPVGEKRNFCVKTYVDYIMAHADDYPNEVPLLEAMLNYVAATEKYFYGKTDIVFKQPTVTAKDLVDYRYSVLDQDQTNDYIGQVINLDGKVNVKLYFSYEYLVDSSFTVLQNRVKINYTRLSVGRDDKGTYLEISGINADEMGDPFTIIVGDITINNYSVFSYVRSAINGTTEGLYDVVAALYEYGCAAKEYAKNVA